MFNDAECCYRIKSTKCPEIAREQVSLHEMHIGELSFLGQLLHGSKHVRSDIYPDNPRHEWHTLSNDEWEETRLTAGIEERLTHTQFTDTLIPIGKNACGRIKVEDLWRSGCR